MRAAMGNSACERERLPVGTRTAIVAAVCSCSGGPAAT